MRQPAVSQAWCGCCTGEALEYGEDEVPDETRRTEHYRQKGDSFAATQSGGALVGQPGAAHVFSLIFAVAQWRFAVPQIARTALCEYRERRRGYFTILKRSDRALECCPAVFVAAMSSV
jgi:hypothetical protein